MMQLIHRAERGTHTTALDCICKPVLVIDEDEGDVRLFHNRIDWRGKCLVLQTG